ncbi:E3 ubiquitin-protein ligase RSL1 [Diospyros lotus]|uniref:E3 ubiquitin-protein ligase RSL1 n=1 Tax=Diospyros lotus TaxID=55363 RepID=UPI0022546758|nr:E3 ubiquitin-protein ligase RSL1 [Diospyros lotus]XP_052202430.1 E3 ubiquitin-protein ligase RSL1 [Diospyros lotus]XP_052202431.1 E3 ubiquitin-protein ligase RSL1 [Diospyros lotus]
MEIQAIFGPGSSSVNTAREVRAEEDEEEFRSCCEDEDELKEREESAKERLQNNLDDVSVNMFFKGVSMAGSGEFGAGLSGIGVVMERSDKVPPIQVQKKLDFYVDESVANYLALMDGLLEAAGNKIKRVFAFTDSEILYDQIVNGKKLENPLLQALGQRILEHAEDLEDFVLHLAPLIDLERPLRLAQVAIGVVSFLAEGDEPFENCSICCEEKPIQMMITMKCSHKFCSHCMKTYVDGKVLSAQVPIRCPQLGCKYYISTIECRSFLPVTSYEMLERALAEANVLNSDKIYCPFSSCSVLLDPHECLSARASSSSQSESNCVECPVCQRFICVECEVPWHSSMSCEEYQNLPLEEREAGDITLHRLAQNKRWRRCQQCRRMIELTHGCYHMTCWCGHEFCYSCGAGYREGQQTCQCAFWDEENSEEDLVAYPTQESEQWAWDSFDSIPTIMDAYTEQERSQLLLIQRFLAGGFSLSDQHPYQSPPRCTDSYVDAMKDLHQLPWLERFVSVISDNYYEDYIQ